MVGAPLLFVKNREGWPNPSLIARVERFTCSFQACSSLLGMGLIDLPLRASNEGLLGRALREHRRSSGSIPSLCSASTRDGWGLPSPTFLDCLGRAVLA